MCVCILTLVLVCVACDCDMPVWGAASRTATCVDGLVSSTLFGEGACVLLTWPPNPASRTMSFCSRTPSAAQDCPSERACAGDSSHLWNGHVLHRKHVTSTIRMHANMFYKRATLQVLLSTSNSIRRKSKLILGIEQNRPGKSLIRYCGHAFAVLGHLESCSASNHH